MADAFRMADVNQRRLVFEVGGTRHEIDAAPVMEVIRTPHITRVPHGPDALEGIANLRGAPVPVMSMRKILDIGSTAARRDGKVILYDLDGAVGLLVDDVIQLSVDATTAPLHGLKELLSAAFKVSRRPPVARSAVVQENTLSEPGMALTALLCFRVAGQLHGLPLDCVREVVPLSDNVAVISSAASAVVGMTPLRDRTLPLVRLAPLLGLDAEHADRSTRIVIVQHDEDLVGLIVDEMDVIRRIPHHNIDAVPPVLQRGRGDAQIEAIGRIAEGQRLISILSPEKLFGHQAVTKAVKQNAGAKPMGATRERDDRFETFLIFQLGEENYGLPIGSVDEVVAVPSDITRVPGAPAFVLGLINLRGKAVPLIDQRSRFEAPGALHGAKARAVIVTLGSLQAGFVVDAVSEVKAFSTAALSAAPEFSSDRTDVFDRIAHIDGDGRMILVIDPQELLSRAERDVVALITQEKRVVADP